MSTGRRSAIAAAIAGALSTAAALAGCGLMSPAQVETHQALLSKRPSVLPQKKTRAVTLLVFSPDTAPIYDTTRMAYTQQPYQVAYFSQHEWAETPSQMLLPLMVEALQRTHAFSAVVVPPYAGHVGYSLRTQLVELMQDFTSEPAVLHLSLRCELSDDAANRVIGTRDISLREPMRDKTPYAGVVAANEAVAKALQELARFVIDQSG